MSSSHKFRFYGDGDHEPGKEPGDVIIQLEEKPHDYLQRHGTDLSMKLDLTLSEALCGMKKVIKTLDNREIVIQTKPGEVIKHGDMKMIEGEGFPTYKNPFTKGRLILVCSIDFPDSLTADAAKKIASALPPRPKISISSDAEEVHIEKFDGKGTWGGEKEENGDDDDDEDQPHGPGIRTQQCAQQ